MDSITYRGFRLSPLNEDIFKLNLIKYLSFEVPAYYEQVESLRTTLLHSKH